MKKVGSKKRLLVSTLIVVTFAFLTGAAFYSTFWLEATATRESELDSILTREIKRFSSLYYLMSMSLYPQTFAFIPSISMNGGTTLRN